MLEFDPPNPPHKLDFHHALLTPKPNRLGHVSRQDVANLELDGAVPLIVANMDHIGTFAIAEVLKPFRLMVALLKDFTVQEWEEAVRDRQLDPRLLIPTFGVRDLPQEIAKLRGLVERFPTIPFVCLDVANGYLQSAADAVKAVKDALPEVRVAAGNIVEAEGLLHLHEAGASIIKVGIGSGGVCLTRKMTGVGYPQLSAIHDLAPLAHSLGVRLISDGGMTDPGAAVKAWCAGAHYVMAGSYFAGHEETGLEFHGMSSTLSRTLRGQQQAKYRASEGREVVLKSRGSLAHTVSDLLGGIRSSMTMINADDVGELPTTVRKATICAQMLNRIEGIDQGQ